MTFGEKLHKLRKSRNMSQDMLADRLGLTRQAVSKWEMDSTLPDGTNVVKIAQLFNVSTDYLLKENEQAYPAKILYRRFDSYGNINFIAAVSAALTSVIGTVYYFIRMINDYTFSITLRAMDETIFIYGNRVIYEIADEIVILVFLAVIIIISLSIGWKIYKKYR